LFNKPLFKGRGKKIENYAKRKEKKETQNGYPQTQEAFEKEQT
jgi:hypothetical protein